jgi:cation transport ATPase
MLTGDHKNTAQYIASLMGIDRIYSEVNPEKKLKL